ncbi:DUF3293 domain-containing protein [Nitrosomonas marina]|uniref:DUF3293 domain-containing protein n=1 Tax=Nitrosomonas marina TaxID=917 RepID=A0A1H8AQK5_9PROT|nr:DUF3293 domain-containing protein [Nitrosomonas marina]SEM73012.1 Protein of unknown function [Nitrosomonas marina]
MTSKLPEILVAQYRLADYRVGSGTDAFIMHIDRYSAPMNKLMTAKQVSNAAIITAYNPLGRRQSAQNNREAHVTLQGALDRRAVCLIESTNLDPAGTWPDETGFCVLGVRFETVCALGLRFRQNAIVWIHNDAVPRLHLLR